jgi:putative aminopeptidase FrvX
MNTLLKTLCETYAPAGEEELLTQFLLNYIAQNKTTWKVQPQVFSGDDFQNCIVLVFGKPRTAVFAHIDSIGFTHRYNNQLVKLGGPRAQDGYKLVGYDADGQVKGTLVKTTDDNGHTTLALQSNRTPERGTNMVFDCEYVEDEDYIQSCYMDNRLGVYNTLKLAETLTDGIICFSTWEETGGGSVEFLTKFIFEKYNIRQTLISDITWITEGVEAGKGCAISMRDSGIPRKAYINKIIALAKQSGIPFQLEVEDAGGSDGNVINKSPYPIDWCFVGAAEQNVHSPTEKVHKKDIDAMLSLYQYLMLNL